MVKNYTDQELLEKVQSLKSFDCLPGGFWIIGVRSKEDLYNRYDDKFYLFLGDKFIMVLTGTTHSGGYGLKNFFKWNSKGTAHIKSDEWYYNVYMKSDGKAVRHHNSRIPCLRQIKPFKYYRDDNKDRKVDEVGRLYTGVIAANFHPNSYRTTMEAMALYINGWSTACQVTNNIPDYYKMLDLIPSGTPITYCLINEF